MKKVAIFICSLFFICSLSGCFNAIHSNQDVVNSIMSLYSDYNIKVIDSSDDCVILKIEKGE